MLLRRSRLASTKCAALLALCLCAAPPAAEAWTPAPVPALAEDRARSNVHLTGLADIQGREGLEIDVSVRAVPVTSSFDGTELTVFGSVVGSRQPSAESGYYDVVVAVEGAPTKLIVRRKTQTIGIWINTSSIRYDDVPSFYALSSTRPIEEIAGPGARRELLLGLEHLAFSPAPGEAARFSSDDLLAFRSAVTRLKQREALYRIDDYGVVFTGRSLFRCGLDLPQNVPLGPLTVRVHLFRDGELLATRTVTVRLERQGVQRHVHDLALRRPFIYGCAAVVFAALAGLAASHIFRRFAH